MKLAADGSYRWHTFYGAAGDDWGYGVVVDSRGSGYLSGVSPATWPGNGNSDPLHAYSGGWDVVIVRLATCRLNLPVVLLQYP